MNRLCTFVAFWLITGNPSFALKTRAWTDTSGGYSIDAKLIALSDTTVVLQRAGPPQWVVVTGRDSRHATANALAQFPGHLVGPVRRVSRR